MYSSVGAVVVLVDACFRAFYSRSCLITKQRTQFMKLASEMRTTFKLNSTFDVNGSFGVLSTAALASLVYTAIGMY